MLNNFKNAQINVQPIFDEMEIDLSHQTISKFKEINDGIAGTIFLSLIISSSLLLVDKFWSWSSLGIMATSFIPAFLLTTLIDNIAQRTEGAIYSWLPFYGKYRRKYILDKNKINNVLNKEDNKFAILHFFELMLEEKAKQQLDIEPNFQDFKEALQNKNENNILMSFISFYDMYQKIYKKEITTQDDFDNNYNKYKEEALKQSQLEEEISDKEINADLNILNKQNNLKGNL